MTIERPPVTANDPASKAEPLTPRIAQTLELLLDGGSEKEMAVRLGVSRHTVHVYVKFLYRHFGVSSRAELMALVLKAFARSLTSAAILDRVAAAERLSRPPLHDPLRSRTGLSRHANERHVAGQATRI